MGQIDDSSYSERAGFKLGYGLRNFDEAWARQRALFFSDGVPLALIGECGKDGRRCLVCAECEEWEREQEEWKLAQEEINRHIVHLYIGSTYEGRWRGELSDEQARVLAKSLAECIELKWNVVVHVEETGNVTWCEACSGEGRTDLQHCPTFFRGPDDDHWSFHLWALEEGFDLDDMYICDAEEDTKHCNACGYSYPERYMRYETTCMCCHCQEQTGVECVCYDYGQYCKGRTCQRSGQQVLTEGT